MSKNDNESKRQYEQIGEYVRIFQRGQTWHANFQQGGRQHRESLKTRSLKEARRRAQRLELEIATGQFRARPQIPTVAEAVAKYIEYLTTEKRAAKTLAKYATILNRVVSVCSEMKIQTLDRLNLGFIDRYRTLRVKAGKAPKTVYTETVVIRQLVNFARSRELLTDDPLKGLKTRKPKPTVQPCWTNDEVGRILTAAPADLRPTLTLLAETGMRFGELAWLTWQDIDTKANVIRIRAKDGWKPKTGDHRNIPISDAVKFVLNVLPRKTRWVVTMPPSATYRRRDRQWSERRLLTMLQCVLKKLELPGKIHTFRHYFISNALLHGVPTATVRSWVGHVDDTILALYTHVHDEASQAAMQRLAKANSEKLQPEASNNDRKATDGVSAQIQHKTQEEKND